jgi:hypothetical protein
MRLLLVVVLLWLLLLLLLLLWCWVCCCYFHTLLGAGDTCTGVAEEVKKPKRRSGTQCSTDSESSRTVYVEATT